jgi:CelD/BcsL family acetyltransferase involved in cellulose biosynthesis
MPDGSSVRVRILEGSGAFAVLGAAWDALVRAQAVPNPTMSSTWLRQLVSWEPGVPVVVLAELGDRILAGAALGIRRPLGLLGPRVATWLGTSNYHYSPDLLVDHSMPEAGTAVMDAVLGHVDAVDLSVPADGLLAKTLRRCVAIVDEQHGTDGWLMPLPPPRLDYAAHRAEYELRRAARRGAAIEMTVARRPAEIAPALERAFEIHRARWEGDPSAIQRFSSRDADRMWYRRTLGVMAEDDAVRIVEVTEDGQPVAAVVGLQMDAGSMFHIMAVSPHQHLRQPGHIALLGWVNEAAANSASVMDLGWGAGGPNSPKGRFGPERVPIVRLRCAERSRDRILLRRLAAMRQYQIRGARVLGRWRAVGSRGLFARSGSRG